MSLSRLAWAAGTALLFVACYRDAEPAPLSHPEPTKPLPPPSTYDQLEAKLGPALHDLPKLETAVSAGDCGKLAAALRAFGATHAADLDDIGALRDRLSPEERLDFDDKHEADGNRVRALVESAMSTCPKDQDVRQGLDVAGFRRKKMAEPTP